MRRNILVSLSLGAMLAVVGCKHNEEHEEKIALGDVPTSVRTAFDTAHPGATVTKVEKEEKNGKDIYEFKYTDSSGKTEKACYDSMGMMVKE